VSTELSPAQIVVLYRAMRRRQLVLACVVPLAICAVILGALGLEMFPKFTKTMSLGIGGGGLLALTILIISIRLNYRCPACRKYIVGNQMGGRDAWCPNCGVRFVPG